MASRISKILATAVFAASATGSVYIYSKKYANAQSDILSRKEISLSQLPSRSTLVERLEKEDFDVLVIGGGATGLGVALDAQTRGLRTALIERDDFASGTSSRSTKLIHGGVRYLEKAFKNLDIGQYRLVQEALQERHHLLNIAPHLSRPLPIILPIYHSFPSLFFYGPYYWIGCKMYDLVAGSRRLEPSYWISRREALEKFPMLKRQGLKGGVVYYDGQMNDSRVAVALAQTAVAEGATCVNHVEVVGLTKDEQGKVNGARVRDQITGREWEVRARSVVNATGPFADSIRKLDNPNAQNIISPSSGVHIVLSDRYSPEGMGLIVPSSDGRVLFLLPWEHGTVAGTTDSSSEITALPRPHEDEIKFIIDETARFLEAPVTRNDVDAAWSGIRPLAKDPNASNTASISRDHVIEVTPSGLVTIAGGKWTTYRKMAEDAVDRVCVNQEELKAKAKPCRSTDLPLMGAAGWSLAMASGLIRKGFSQDVAEHLSHCYGDKAPYVAKIALEEGTSSLLARGWPFIEAEVLYGVRHEYACTAIDVLSRRTRLAFLQQEAALASLPRVIELMSRELGWDETRRLNEYTKGYAFLKTMANQGRSSSIQCQSDRETLKKTEERLRRVFESDPLSRQQLEHLQRVFLSHQGPAGRVNKQQLAEVVKHDQLFSRDAEKTQKFIQNFNEDVELEEFLFAAAKYGRR
eukprot:TRINITY_DN7530_c0_g1_i2.p1 TRINITY_DN7530_c0_g1~~TRINITY_DN7530_c0_g1_i2.p1  ORF type:complete len:715 (-),score=231.78 TRINITY_DN7530_c0_g1_i2:111-2192(-)